MKTIALSRPQLFEMIKILLLLSLGIFWIWNQNLHAAGAPARPSQSPDDKRSTANVYFESGEKLQKAGDYQRASRKYERAVRIDPDYAEAWSNLGYTYRKIGNFKDAVMAYKKAIRIAPDLAEAHEYLGEAYAEMGKFDLAEKELEILRQLGAEEAKELEEFITKLKSGQSQ